MRFDINQLSQLEQSAVIADDQVHKLMDPNKRSYVRLSWKAVFVSIAISLRRLADQGDK